MNYSGALRYGMDQPTPYQPTLLELAREGNFRAIAFWINSLLEPQGIHADVGTTRAGRLKIQLHFLRPGTRTGYAGLQEQIVRFICYRLWTLNSAAIDDVWIVARRLGDPEVLWRQAVRIATPANAQRLRTRRPVRRRSTSRYRFQIFRAVVLSGLTTGGFFLGYWLFYLKVMGNAADRTPQETILYNTPNSPTSPHSGSLQVNSMQPTLDLINQRVTKPGNPGNRIPQEYQGKIVYSVALTGPQKLVALTFDDGPWEGSTGQVLDILKQFNVRATFFMIGRQVEQSPDLARRVVAEGHAIGNHTWNHPLTDVEATAAQAEVDRTRQLIEQTTGVKTQLFRPPGGNLNTRMVEYAKQQDQAVLMWSSDSEDYYVGAPLVINNVLSQVKPGGIVLMHDGGSDRTATLQALPQVIQVLQQQGYQFVTVPELLEAQRHLPESSASSTVPALNSVPPKETTELSQETVP